MTNISYAILAHNNPEQLGRLIAKLNAENVRFFIHIDAKVDIEPFSRQTSTYSNVDFVTNRIDVKWGAYSVLEAYLECLRFIREIAPDSFAIHLSGQDYPVKSNQYIGKYIDQHCDKIFLAHFKLPYAGWAGNGGLDRVFGYAYVLGNKKLVKIKPLSFTAENVKNIVKVAVLKPRLFPMCFCQFFKKRRFPLNYTSHWGGEFWSSMPMKITSQILDILDSDKRIEKYYRQAGHPDEIMLHTIVLNNEHLANKVVNNCLKYIDWSEKRALELPLTFTIDEKEDIKNAVINMPDTLFARKFGDDTEILGYIDSLTSPQE